MVNRLLARYGSGYRLSEEGCIELRRTFAFPGCEVFITCMMDHVNRFAEAPSVAERMEELFGNAGLPQRRVCERPDWVPRTSTVGSCESSPVFKYASRFEMRRADGHIAYHLFHGTSHIRGVEVMKQGMW